MTTTRQALVERMKEAIEGECDGLVIDDHHAGAILDYVLASAPLDDDRITDIWAAVSPVDGADMDIHEFARAIERAHGITGSEA